MNSKTPFLFLSFGLASWGWLLDTPEVAGFLLLMIFISYLSTWRWQLTLMQFFRWGDLSTLLLILLGVYVFVLQPTERAIFVVLKWLPVIFVPLLWVQLFSTQQALPLGTFFYSLRKQDEHKNQPVDFTLPYSMLTMLSAGAANRTDLRYFVLIVIFFSGVLWTTRSRQRALSLWLLTLICVTVSSYFGFQSLRNLQNLVEEQSVAWFRQWQDDPFKVRTAIGDIGELKGSDKIEFRVKADSPLLLMQQSYDVYLGQHWLVSNSAFKNANVFNKPATIPFQSLEILQTFSQQAILALPDGTQQIKGLENAFLQANELGALKVLDAPELADYQVFYSGQRLGKSSKFDLQVPKQHLDWLIAIHRDLKTQSLSPIATANALKNYFQQHFLYSLYLGEETDADLALRNFILQRKAGHCEYFAVATVLLLRQAKIPARLATGYAVQEAAGEPYWYVVRSRHAHAWAIAYLNGVWWAVDSTPSQWLLMENAQASIWQPLEDGFSNLHLKLKQFWQTQNRQHWLWFGFGLLTAYLIWKIAAAKRQLMRRKIDKMRPIIQSQFTKQALPFYQIEAYLCQQGQEKSAHETLQQWLVRLQHPELQAVCRWHYQQRFDPQGISVEKQFFLEQAVQTWLKNHIAKRAKTSSAKVG